MGKRVHVHVEPRAHPFALQDGPGAPQERPERPPGASQAPPGPPQDRPKMLPRGFWTFPEKLSKINNNVNNKSIDK